MRQAALNLVLCVLAIFTTAFLPGIGRDGGTSTGSGSLRKAIPVRPPSLSEAVRLGRSGIHSLLLRVGEDSDAGEKGGHGPLMVSLHGGLRHLHARGKREESAVHVAVLEGRGEELSQFLAAGGSPTHNQPITPQPLAPCTSSHFFNPLLTPMPEIDDSIALQALHT